MVAIFCHFFYLKTSILKWFHKTRTQNMHDVIQCNAAALHHVTNTANVLYVGFFLVVGVFQASSRLCFKQSCIG